VHAIPGALNTLQIIAPRTARNLDIRAPLEWTASWEVRHVSEASLASGAISAVRKIALEAYLLAKVLQTARKINVCHRRRPEARFFHADGRDRGTDMPDLPRSERGNWNIRASYIRVHRRSA
jgi:hypothetical protein